MVQDSFPFSAALTAAEKCTTSRVNGGSQPLPNIRDSVTSSVQSQCPVQAITVQQKVITVQQKVNIKPMS